MNPAKAEVIAFTKKTGIRLEGLHLDGVPLPVVEQVKYLEEILDKTGTWKAHLDSLVVKVTNMYWSCGTAVGRNGDYP